MAQLLVAYVLTDTTPAMRCCVGQARAHLALWLAEVLTERCREAGVPDAAMAFATPDTVIPLFQQLVATYHLPIQFGIVVAETT